MYYELNIAKNNLHYFATHKRSISTKDKAKEILKHFKEVFPESKGYTITVTEHSELGEDVTEDY